MKYRLEVGQYKWIDLDLVNELWFQVIGIYNCGVEAKVGDMIRRTNRGWEVFETLDATSPKYVLPTAVTLIEESDEEE